MVLFNAFGRLYVHYSVYIYISDIYIYMWIYMIYDIYICVSQEESIGIPVTLFFHRQVLSDAEKRKVRRDIGHRGCFRFRLFTPWNPLQDPQAWHCFMVKWVWVNTYENTIFNGMNIHLPAILGFTRYQGFDPSPNGVLRNVKNWINLDWVLWYSLICCHEWDIFRTNIAKENGSLCG